MSERTLGADPVEVAPLTSAPRSMRANVASLATSQAITWTLAMLWTFFVPRLIGPEELGLLTIAISVTAFVAVVLSVTTKEFLVREIVARPADASSLVTLALLLRLAALPVVYIAAVVYGRLANLDSHAMTVMFLVCAGTVCGMLAEPALASFQATERMQFIAYTDVTNKTLQTAGGIALALAGFGVLALASLSLAVGLFTLSVALWWTHRLVGLRARPAPIVPVVRRAGPYWFVAVFYIGYLWADGMLLGVFASPEVVGWYGAAIRLFSTMMFVAVIISTASLPRLVAAFHRSPDSLYVESRRPFAWVLILGLPLGVGLACVAGSVVPLFYGPEYLNAVPVLAILGLTLPAMYVNIVVAQVFVASGRPLKMARLLSIAAVINVGLNALLIPYAEQRWGNGAIGAGVSLLLTELVQMTLALAMVGRRLLNQETVSRVLRAAGATAGMAAVLIPLDLAPLLLPVEILLGGIVFGLAAIVLRVPTAEELLMARRAIAGLGRRGLRAQSKEQS